MIGVVCIVASQGGASSESIAPISDAKIQADAGVDYFKEYVPPTRSPLYPIGRTEGATSEGAGSEMTLSPTEDTSASKPPTGTGGGSSSPEPILGADREQDALATELRCPGDRLFMEQLARSVSSTDQNNPEWISSGIAISNPVVKLRKSLHSNEISVDIEQVEASIFLDEDSDEAVKFLLSGKYIPSTDLRCDQIKLTLTGQATIEEVTVRQAPR